MMNPYLVRDDDQVPWSCLRVRGDEARSFLQGQLSCDVGDLVVGQHRAGLLLAPSGEVVAVLDCVGTDDGIDLVTRREVGDDALRSLRRFLLRTRCEISLVADVEGPYATYGDQVRRGEPGPREWAPGLAAHTFGTRFVARHVSFSKGCFTGQELVGRLDARGGNVPFRLARVTGTSLDDMQRVCRSAGPQGERAVQGLRTVLIGEPFVGLGLVHRTLTGDQPSLDDFRVRVELLHGEPSEAPIA